MKRLLVLALFLCQCSSPNLGEIEPSSIDLEDFKEQNIELSELPFSIAVPSHWEARKTSFEHQLWKSAELQLVFSLSDDELQIPEGATVIQTENPDITVFCLSKNCIVQAQGEGLFAVQALTEEGQDTLKRLR